MAHRKLSVIEIIVLCLVALLTAIGVLLVFTNLTLFEKYVQEDGLVEWIGVFALLAAFVVCLRRALQFFSEKPWYFIFTSLLLGMLLLFAAGEEISWGQRIFDIDTPEYFKQNNLQAETNLHNLEINGVKINKIVFSYLLIFVLVIYLGLFPLLYAKKKWMNTFVNKWGIPLAQRYQIIGFILLFSITEMIPHGKRAEVLECGAALLFFLIVYFPANAKTFKKG